MKTFKIIIALLTVLVTSTTLRAQRQRVELNINYTVASPSGAFEDFINEASWRGWTASALYGLSDKLSIGLGTGFHDFYQKFPRDVYQLQEGGEISAVVTNSIQTIPILATVKYKLIATGMLQPYIAAGVGGNVIMYSQYLGEFANSRSDFGFAVRPEAGVFIPVGKRDFGLNINGIYNYMPYKKSGLENLNSWGVGVGIKIPLR